MHAARVPSDAAGLRRRGESLEALRRTFALAGATPVKLGETPPYRRGAFSGMVAAMRTTPTKLHAARVRRRGDPLGIVIVDDHPAVRQGLAALLEVEGDLAVLAA